MKLTTTINPEKATQNEIPRFDIGKAARAVIVDAEGEEKKPQNYI